MLSAGQPVYPQEKPSGPSGEGAAQVAAETPAAVSQAIEIDGKQFTPDQIREAIQGNMRQRDYTQKTQAVSEREKSVAQERRELEAEWEKLQADKARLMASSSNVETDPFSALSEENPALANALRTLDQRQQKVERAFDEQERERMQQKARAQLNADYENVLSQVESQSRPLFNRDEVRTFMIENNLAPNQVNLAYSALYGGKLGEKYGEQQAIARGASAQPYMGAGQTRVSPTFTGPHDLPGGPKIEGMSWANVAKLAANDPEIPR